MMRRRSMRSMSTIIITTMKMKSMNIIITTTTAIAVADIITITTTMKVAKWRSTVSERLSTIAESRST